MTLKEKSKTYSFWISLVSAVLILVRTIAEYFGAEINHNFALSVATGICGILVIVGLLNCPKKQSTIEEFAEESKQIEKEVETVNQMIKEDIQNTMQNMTIEEQLEFLKNSQNQEEKSSDIGVQQPEENLIEIQPETENIIEEQTSVEVVDEEPQAEPEAVCENKPEQEEQNFYIGNKTKEELKELLVLILEKLELI